MTCGMDDRRRIVMPSVATLLLALAVSLATAMPANAEPPSAVEDAVLLQINDLVGDYGRVVTSYSNSPGPGGALPSTCSPLTQGAPDVMGKESSRVVLNDIEFAGSLRFTSTIFTYPTSDEARASFDQIATRTVAYCNGEATLSVGDDGLYAPAALANTARRMTALPSPVGSVPRFANASSTILLTPKDVPVGYTNDFSFAVTLGVANAVIQVQAYKASPLSAVERADVVRAGRAVAMRYATAPWK